MKRFLLIGDGMADDPGPNACLCRAKTPYMDRLAAKGRLGRVITIPAGMEAGSDVAILGILGYAPETYHAGRGPLEAVGLGVDVAEDEVVFRCNLVWLDQDRMGDYSAGGLSDEEGHRLILDLQEALGEDGVRFVPGVGYRHLLVLRTEDPEALVSTRCKPPHSITGQAFSRFLPQGPQGSVLLDLMEKAQEILRDQEVNVARRRKGLPNATAIWPWGGGCRAHLPSFESMWGLRAAVISAVSLVKSIGQLAGMDVIHVEGATGYLDSNLAGKVEASLRFLREGGDLAIVHVEAPDEAGHHKNAEEKVQAIERFDREVVGGILEATEGWDRRFLVLSDHRTPVTVGDHTPDWVPWVISDGGRPGDMGTFHEMMCAETPCLDSGPAILRLFLRSCE